MVNLKGQLENNRPWSSMLIGDDCRCHHIEDLGLAIKVCRILLAAPRDNELGISSELDILFETSGTSLLASVDL